MNPGTTQPGRQQASPADGAARLQTRLRWEQLAQSGRPTQCKVAVLASFTAQPLVPYLGVALEQSGTAAEIWVGPYNQIMSQCLDEASELATYRPDLLVCWPRLEELWGGEPLPSSGALSVAVEDALALAEACLGAARRLGATLIFVLPATPELRPLGLGDACSPSAVAATGAAVREAMRRHLAGQAGALLLDAEELVRAVGSTRAYNQRMQAIARIPYAEEVFCMAGQRLARLSALHARTGPQLVVIEPDNVLWGGELAELGPGGVDLDEGGPGELYRQVQLFLLELRRAGARLALVAEHAALDAVLARREMRLRRDDLAAVCAAGPTPAALRALAEDAGAALADTTLITGSAATGAAVAAELPEVAVVVMPEDPAEWLGALQSGAVDQLPAPRDRVADSAPEAGEQARGPLSLDGFLARLAVQVRLFVAEPGQLEHVAHMTHHTSDFHLTGVQRSGDEVAAFLGSEGAECWLIDVRDRLGAYGSAGVLLFTVVGGTLVVDTFLLNCRVLGRNVEYSVLNRLAALAGERGCAEVHLVYRRTARNGVAGAFVRAVGGELVREEEGSLSVTLPIERLAALTAGGQQPSSCPVEAPTPVAVAPAVSAPAAAFVAARWRKHGPEEQARLSERCASFQSGEQILEAIQAFRRHARPDLAETFVAPRTPLEGQLAEAWAQVLGIERVGVRDNFFHLGGHSILATQLVMRLYDLLGVELPVRIFFETPTVESMAQAIDIVRRTGDDTAFIAEAPTYVKAEAELDPTIVPDGARPAEHSADPRRIFLTGATGYLGAFLLDELLRRTRAEIVCLVRAGDIAEGKARISANLAHYGLWDEALSERVSVALGDLAQPLLGLAEERFLELADTVDVIYHAGAITSFIYPYTTLKPTNVLGTQEVLRLASRIRLKPVHFTSSLYVFGPGDKPEGRAVREDDIPEAVETMHIGYRQSKWVADRLVMAARERGIPANIYRPSRIAGHSATGACQTNDFVWRMIRACIDSGSVFDQDMSMDMVPVDYVSQAIVHLSLKPALLGSVFHLTNPRVPYLNEIVAWSQAYGYPIRRESYEVWRGRLKEAAERSRDNASFALVPFLPQDLSRQQLGDLPFDHANTLAGLADAPIACPQIDEARFHIYLDYFTRSGFLRAPQRIAAAEADTQLLETV